MNGGMKCCSFCRNLQIPGPHDHTIRDFTQKNSPIICPELLKIECGYCHDIGHTTGYCPVLKAKKAESNYNSFPTKQETSSDKKRVQVIDKDGFQCIPMRNFETDKLFSQQKVQKMNVLISAYAALNVEGDESDDNIGSDSGENDVNISDSVTSTDYISNQELKNKIGIKNNTRWADEDIN